MNYKLQEFSHFFYDFDGVMTDNTFLQDENGLESVRLNRADGFAIDFFKKKMIKQIILSTEKNKVVLSRSKKLNIECFYGVDNKKIFIEKFIRENINIKKICYVGNDLNDLHAMELCHLKICPFDSAVEIKNISDYITQQKGGEGVIRNLMDIFK